ncbi:unnamed protein product [Pleuronectes platessa]|uniref:Uncharacterized protein n=1 Tax=Pleuronectes platessa TaxID=8262 RepID=A0A9N7ZDB3_PLEPL|nr:unnamed protein product [Pleuronectes platessa]
MTQQQPGRFGTELFIKHYENKILNNPPTGGASPAHICTILHICLAAEQQSSTRTGEAPSACTDSGSAGTPSPDHRRTAAQHQDTGSSLTKGRGGGGGGGRKRRREP